MRATRGARVSVGVAVVVALVAGALGACDGGDAAGGVDAAGAADVLPGGGDVDGGTDVGADAGADAGAVAPDAAPGVGDAADTTGDLGSPSDGGAPDVPPATPLEVHVFGTLTSVQSSEGADLTGVWHDEEALPAFVAGRYAPEAGPTEAVPPGITHKLQALVVTLHGEAGAATVRVDVPTGLPSRWHPAPQALVPPAGEGAALSGGSVTFSAAIDPTAPQGGDEPGVWSALRAVGAPMLASGERFLFAQAVASLDLPLSVEALQDGTFRVTNASDQEIPAAWLVHVHDGGGLRLTIGALAPGESKVQEPTPKEIDLDEYTKQASAAMRAALEGAGLTAAEAEGLIGTWSWSVFHTKGLRLLYLPPPGWLEAALPVTVTPAPAGITRAIVGRIEVLTPPEEQALAGAITAAAAGTGAAPAVEALGVFAEPRLRRALELLTDPDAQALCQQLIDQIAQSAQSGEP